MAPYVTLSNPLLHPDVAYAMKVQLIENLPEDIEKSRVRAEKEWGLWCERRYDPIPADWASRAKEHIGQLPGHLVDETKLLRFIQEIMKRPPKKGKGQNIAKHLRRRYFDHDRGEPPRKKARMAVDLDQGVRGAGGGELLEAEDDEIDVPAVILLYKTVCEYISVIQNVYDRQKTVGENFAPHPQGAALKVMVEDILLASSKTHRAEYGDRLTGSIKDAYSIAAIPQYTRAAWRITEKKSLPGALRTSLDFLLGNHMLLRLSSRREIELPDLFCLELPKVDVKQDARAAEIRTPSRALVVILRQGKLNQLGQIEYGAALRHRDPMACLISQLAFWYFWRWQVEGSELFPSLDSRADWYHNKLIRRSDSELNEALSAKTSMEWAKRMYDLCKLPSTQVTHLPRVASAPNVEEDGVSEAQIRRPGRWTSSDPMTSPYLASLPLEYMRAVADFDPNWSGSYFIGRATATPPESLLSRVWPDLDKWNAKYNERIQKGIEEELATGAFIELMMWLRTVLLQDSVFLMKEFPSHPIFQDPLFATAEYEVFANKVREAHITAVVDSNVSAIEKAAPVIADKLRVLSATTVAHQKRTDVWHESHEAAIDRLTRENKKLLEELRKMREEQKAYFAGSWIGTCNIQFTHVPQQRQQEPITLPAAVVSIATTSSSADSSDPSDSSLDNSSNNIPNLKLPRDITTVTDLVRLWTEGYGSFPAIQKLEEKWGARWRPNSEKNFFYERNTIITEVFRQAAQSQLDPMTVAANMDRTLPHKSINKWFKTIQAQGKAAV